MGLPPKDYDGNAFTGVAPNDLNGQGDASMQTGDGEGRRPSTIIIDITPASGLQRFAMSNKFLNFTLLVIVLNGIWIGIDVEWNHPKLGGALEPGSIVVENIFCSYFTFEIVVRILAFGKKNICDKSFLFDFVLVLFMILETWVMALIQALTSGEGGGDVLAKFTVLRLLRLTRLMRLATSLPELLTLVRGMFNAAKAVGIVLLFMLILMYIFAIIFTAQIGDNEAREHDILPYYVTGQEPTAVQLFGSMLDSMMSLFTRGMLGDNLAQTLIAIKDHGGGADSLTCELEEDVEMCDRPGGELWLMWVFILFMCLSAFCLLNMLVGVLCEVITETANLEMELNQVNELQRNISCSFHDIDESGDELITKNEWKTMRTDKRLCASFRQIGVQENYMDFSLDQMEEHLFGRLGKNQIPEDRVWFPDAASVITDDSKNGIPVEEFFHEILDIRPDQPASYLDLCILQTRAEKDEAIFLAELDRIESSLRQRRSNPSLRVPPSLADGQDKTAPADAQNTVQRIPKEGPNNGTSSAPDPWLLGISTDILFAELKYRASLQANSSKSAVEVD